MKRHDDIVQGSIEWHELKWGKIGGTLSKGLFVKSDTLLIDILSQRMEEFEPEDGFSNDPMERGNELEPFALEYLSNYTGLEFVKSGWLECEENELLGISPDGITDDNTISAECKCFGRKKHFEVILNDEIPLENIPQQIHYFTINPELKKHYFIAFRPEAPKHFIKELTPDSIVNIGTKARPVLKTIDAIRWESLNEASKLLAEIKEKELLIKSDL